MERRPAIAARRGRPVRLHARPSALDVDVARSALVVVDMQNDFLHPEGWFPAAGVDPRPLLAVVDPIRRLAAALRAQSVPVIWLNWGVLPGAPEVPSVLKQKGARNGERPTYGDVSATGRGRILVRGDWGSATYDDMEPQPGDSLVHKHRLSGFYDNELDSVLRNRGIETLFFAGVNIDRCVYGTLCDAAARGFQCVLVEDACATSSPAYVTEAIFYLVELLHGSVATCAQVSDALRDPPLSSTGE